MQFFPHRTSPTSIGQATSASRSTTAELINNFATIPVATASLALNISGSAGIAGTNYAKIGATGPTGVQGARGNRGNSIYLLSVDWDQAAPTLCYEITDVGTSTLYEGGPDYVCDYNNSVSYYSPTETMADGITLYYDPSCASLAINVADLSHGNVGAFSTNISGVVVDSGGLCVAI